MSLTGPPTSTTASCTLPSFAVASLGTLASLGASIGCRAASLASSEASEAIASLASLASRRSKRSKRSKPVRTQGGTALPLAIASLASLVACPTFGSEALPSQL